MDGGHTEVRARMKRRNNKLRGPRGIRNMLKNMEIMITLDDRKIGFRNVDYTQLMMPGKRYGLPSMIRQDGSMETITFDRLMELANTNVVTVGIREGERVRGYRIMGKVLEEAVETNIMWIVLNMQKIQSH